MRKNEVLHRIKQERNIIHTIKRRKGDWIGHILRRNCFLKCVIEGKIEGRIEVTGRRGRRSKLLLDDLKETRVYWKLKVEALDDGSLCRTRFADGYARVSVRLRKKCVTLIGVRQQVCQPVPFQTIPLPPPGQYAFKARNFDVYYDTSNFVLSTAICAFDSTNILG